AEIIRRAGGEVWGAGSEPDTPGHSLHETGTLRFGKDPKTSVTNGYSQCHDVSNLYAATRASFLSSQTRRLRSQSWLSRCAHANASSRTSNAAFILKMNKDRNDTKGQRRRRKDGTCDSL